MLHNFLISVQAVLPLFLTMMLGVLIRLGNWLNEAELHRLNSVIFKLLFPFTVFTSIYQSDLSTAWHPGLIFFAVSAVLITYFISLFIVPKIEDSNASRGAMIQAIYRSNFVLLGLPLVSNLYPGADLGMPAIAIAVLIPVYNLLAVITLEAYRGGKVTPKRILIGVATNPLILGCIAGILATPFTLPPVLDATVNQISNAAAPMALILLGASLKLRHSPRLRRNLLICTLCRLLVVPGVFLTVAALMGFRDMAFVTLLGVFSAPCAVSSYTMAQQMESDGELAGAVVVTTSFFSCFTMFAWIFLFKQLGLF